MLQDLQGAVLLCVQDLHIQTLHCASSRLLAFFPRNFVEKLDVCCGCCGCVVTVVDITLYYSSAVTVLKFLSVTAVTAVDFG
jgi:hypothetical protein